MRSLDSKRYAQRWWFLGSVKIVLCRIRARVSVSRGCCDMESRFQLGGDCGESAISHVECKVMYFIV